MQKDVAKAIATFEDRQKAEARAKVEALARELGYSLAESGPYACSSKIPAP
jgi:DNA-binding protein H-NS